MNRLNHSSLEFEVLDWYHSKPAACLTIDTEQNPKLKLSEVVLEALRGFYDHTRGQQHVRPEPDKERFQKERRIHYNFWVAPNANARKEDLYGRVELIQGKTSHNNPDDDTPSNLSTTYPSQKYTLIFNTRKDGKYSQAASFEDRDDFLRYFNLVLK
jgi:hypothetical protein